MQENQAEEIICKLEQKSIISKNFFNIIRNYIHCDNCQDYKDLYYFNIEKVLTLEVDGLQKPGKRKAFGKLQNICWFRKIPGDYGI